MKKQYAVHEQQLLDKLFDLMAEFADIQREHTACLSENKLKNMMNWRQHREIAFGHLRQVLDQVVGLAGYDELVRQRLSNELKIILDNEKRLAGLAMVQRDKLQENLRTLRKGKQVLKGYSLYQGGSTRPRYLSNKS